MIGILRFTCIDTHTRLSEEGKELRMQQGQDRVLPVGRRWMPAIILAALSATGMVARAVDSTAGISPTPTTASPQTSQPNQQELLDEVRALRAEVDALKAAKTTQPATISTPATSPSASGSSAVDPTIAAVEKDAAGRQ